MVQSRELNIKDSTPLPCTVMSRLPGDSKLHSVRRLQEVLPPGRVPPSLAMHADISLSPNLSCSVVSAVWTIYRVQHLKA